MNDIMFYLCGNTAALKYAADYLTSRHFAISSAPSQNVTHLLLPVPSFEPSGRIKGGAQLDQILSQLPEDVTVFGGGLNHKALKGKKAVDFLQDEDYLAENAAITAECTMGILKNMLPTVLRGCPVLILGWGRIGKCLGQKLKAAGADVRIFARKSNDRSLLSALGYAISSPETLADDTIRARVIINTAPALLLTREATQNCPDDVLFLDLASLRGIEDERTVWARGLPNRDAPEASGRLIGKTAIKYATQKEVSL